MSFSDNESLQSSSSGDKNKKIFFPDDFGKLDVRIGKILKVEYNPYAKKKKPCFITNVEVGEDVPRCIGSELNYFYKEDELTDRLVVVLCNVKAKKKCNLLSEAWILSACNEEKRLELLDPPRDCEEGEQVTVEGFPIIPDIRDEKIPRTALIKKIMQEVRVSAEKVVEYRRRPLKVEGQAVVTTQSLTDCIVTDSFLKFKY